MFDSRIPHTPLNRENVWYCQNQVFLFLTIIRNQSKSKTISHTVFETFIKQFLMQNSKVFMVSLLSWGC